MYNSDKPIINKNEDTLGRKYFASRLAEAILTLACKDNINIGLYGDWGTGKTSILNMTIEEIEIIRKKSKIKKNIPIIVKFEPWNISDDSNLIVQFFKLLHEELNIRNNNKIYKHLGEIIVDYSSTIEMAEAVPVFGGYAKFIGIFGKFLGRLLGNNSEKSISNVKNKLEKELSKLEHKILIVIDDIDRLSNAQIRMIFQLVSSIASLPNMVYLMAMDKGVVVRALEEVQNCNGELYLEKIIQIPFEIPKLNHRKVLEIFVEKLEQIITDKKVNIYIEDERWSKIYNLCVYNYINSIRDVNRVLNTFNFNYNEVYQEVDFVDMLTITILQVIKPEVYKWILKNKNTLCIRSFELLNSEKDNKKYFKESQLAILSKIDKHPDIIFEILEELFPVFSNKCSEYTHFDSSNNLLRRGNIGHETTFDLYFELNVEDMSFKTTDIVSIISQYDINELTNIFDKVNNNNSIIFLLDTLRSYINDIPNERLGLLVQFLYEYKRWLKGKIQHSFIEVSADQHVEWLIEDLIKRISSKNEVFKILKNLIKQGNLFTLKSMTLDLHRIEIMHGRLTSKEPNIEKQIVSLEQLIELEREFACRMNELLNENEQSLLSLDNLGYLLYYWDAVDEQNCAYIVNKLISVDENVPKFIVRLGSRWTGTSGEGWTFNENNYSKWINDSNILDIIDRFIDNKHILDLLDESELIKLAFYKIIKTSDDDRSNKKDAIKLVKKWKEEQN